MTGDVDRERLKRLRGDLAELRARAMRDQGETDGDASSTVEPSIPDEPASAPAPVVVAAEPGTVLTPVARPATTEPDHDPVTVADDDNDHADIESPHGTEDDGAGLGSEDGTTASEDAATVAAGRASRSPERSVEGTRRRIPRPPRRNPFRRRAHRPPDRLAVPAPIPVERRSVWAAAPRWPVIDWVSGPVIALVMVPVAAQLVFRLWTAMTTTSVLTGADPSRADFLLAAAGVAGGGLTAALAVAALAVVRGRLGYLAGAGATLLMFTVFPYLAYTANAGIVSAPLPSLAEMVAPAGWPRAEQLGAVFFMAAAALAAAVIDLLYRGATAVREGIAESRR